MSVSEARTILNKIIGKTSYTSIHGELPKDEKESSSKQEKEVLIAKSQPFQSQDLSINSEPSILQNPPREEEIPPLEFPVEIKDDLLGAGFGRTLNSHLHKRPSSEYNSNPLKNGSLGKRPYTHLGYWDEFEDGMSSNAIEGEPSQLEANPILSSSMLTLDILSKSIS